MNVTQRGKYLQKPARKGLGVRGTAHWPGKQSIGERGKDREHRVYDVDDGMKAERVNKAKQNCPHAFWAQLLQ